MMSNRAPKVIVITLNWNGKKWLADCLDAVQTLDYPNYEVVLVDNGSTDDSVATVKSRYPAIHVIETGSNLGYSRGFNAGMAFAATLGAEYFLIMNNDTVIDPMALAALVETAQTQERAGFVTGKIYFHDTPHTLQTVGKKEDPILWNGNHIGWGEEDAGQYDQPAERAFVDDVMVLVNRRVYDELGGYDVQYYLQGEGFDWQVRAKKKGWKTYYTPNAKLWHKVSQSMGGFGNPIGRYFDTRSRMVVMARHAPLHRFLLFYLHTGWKTTDSLLRGIVQRKPEKIKPRLARWLGFISGTFWLIHRQPATKVPACIQHLAESQ